MKFSIIVITFNSGDKLRKTVESCLFQDEANFEIVIKDGLSTDCSTAFLSKINDSRIKYYSCIDFGIYDAMNQAISK